MRHALLIAGLIAAAALAGCRGMTSEEPPIHLNPNMDIQQRFEAQEKNAFFANEAAMRPLVPGTVARGMLRENSRFYRGRTANGAYVEEIPVPVTRALLKRGRERFNIYCAVCHGKAGDGNGVIATGDYGYAPIPSYHIDRLREAPDGYLFDVISNGVRNMPGYGAQIPVADRWAIVAYVRALQRSQHAEAGELPASVVARIDASGGANMDGQRTVTLDSGGAESTTNETNDAADASSGKASPPATDDAPAPEEDATAASAGASAPSAESSAADAATPPKSKTTVESAKARGEAVPTEATAPPASETAAPAPASTGGVPTSLLLVLFVALPIVGLTVLLVIAFRKKREH